MYCTYGTGNQNLVQYQVKIRSKIFALSIQRDVLMT